MKVFEVDTDYARVVARELAIQADLQDTPGGGLPAESWGQLGDFSAALATALASIDAKTQCLRQDFQHLSELGTSLAQATLRVDDDNARGFAGADAGVAWAGGSR